MKNTIANSDSIRHQFSQAMSDMYKKEVPAYGTLMELVDIVNQRVLNDNPTLKSQLIAGDEFDRISQERHGAIRLGTAAELSMMARIFAVMGMHPVGYYDLGVAGIPVHSTAFRPVNKLALNRNPFRVFTSLLRLELIKDDALRQQAERILSQRQIFTPRAIELVEQSERNGMLSDNDAETFVSEVLETFRWHADALVSLETYEKLHDEHRLIADVVSFKGPHINHLTPRTLDIDEVQRLMPDYHINPKAIIEGPPTRKCPILLRQTSFKALQEPVSFPDESGKLVEGKHTARFGEIEQRGIALTPKGRALYDKLLDDVRELISPAADGSNKDEYIKILSDVFTEFPDDWNQIHEQGLGYFKYQVVNEEKLASSLKQAGVKKLNDLPKPQLNAVVNEGALSIEPIVYEDFLPVSAAGIFQSNLGDNANESIQQTASQVSFEAALGQSVLDEFGHYEQIQQQSLAQCLAS